MNYKVDFDALDQLSLSINSQTKMWLEELEKLEQKAGILANTEALKGHGAENAKNYMACIYPSVITALRSVISSHMANYLLYKQAYQGDIDTNTHAVLVEEEIKNAIQSLGNKDDDAGNIETVVRNSLNKVSNIVAIPIPSYALGHQQIQTMKDELNALDQNIVALESTHTAADFTQTSAALTALDGFLREMTARSRAYKQNFSATDLAGNQHYYDLYCTTLGIMEDLKEKEDLINEALEEEQERVEILQKEYEEAVAEAAKKREEDGVWKFVTGGLIVLGGAAIIVATWGAATPIVVAGVATGGSAVVYGAANMAEGGQDAYYGSIGDIYTPAWNPVRDTIFGGDQELYDLWGTANLLIGSFVVAPLGVAYSSTAATGTSFGRAAITEIGKRVISGGVGYAAGEGGKWLGTELFDENTGRYIGLGSGIVAGGLTNKGLSVLDHKFGISGRYISDAERVKLNSWDERYRPTDQEYLQYREIFDNPKYIDQKTGAYNWPEDSGFANGSKPMTLQPGTLIDRYGPESGHFLSPEGTPFEQRALFPGTQMKGYSIYEVVKPLEVQGGEVAPWFNQPGGGTQYETSSSIESLIESGILRRIYP